MRPFSQILSIALTFSAASTALALTGLNQCGPGTNPPKGMRCAQDELLLGYRDAAGACLWVCCPPNGDGRTYDCSGEPTASDFKLDLRSVRPRPWTGVFTPGGGSDTGRTAKPGEEEEEASK